MGVFLFVPNIIGYIRIILLFQACYFMRINCELTLLTYIISCFLDAVDGYAARALNQSTKFGAMLDMIVDRCSTMCLLACLTYFYPSYMLFFQFTMIVDIASHWLHVHSSILSGKSSHKSINLNDNRFLKLYYTNRVILFLMCAGNELFYTLLYVYHFYPGPKVFSFGLYNLMICLTAPIAFLKMSISLIQLFASCVNMASLDELERSNNKAN